MMKKVEDWIRMENMKAFLNGFQAQQMQSLIAGSPTVKTEAEEVGLNKWLAMEQKWNATGFPF